MQAIILATGERNDLRPLTDTNPAPMLPIVSRPVMSYSVELLKRQGFKTIHVSLYHHAGSIESYFGPGHRFGVPMNYILQKDAWGTAGALKWAESALQEPFVVMPGDALVDCDLEALIAQHEAKNSVATVVVSCNGSELTPTLFFDENGRVAPEATEHCGRVTGVFIVDPTILQHIPKRKKFDIVRDLLPALTAQDIPVDVFDMDGYWNPLRTFDDYYGAQKAYLTSAWGNVEALNGTPKIRHAELPGLQIADGIWVGRNNVIHPSVRLQPPIFIGDNCRIGREVELGPEAIISQNVIVDDEATICNSAVFNHTYVGQLVNVENRFVNKNSMIDVVSGQRSEITDRFLLDEAAPTTIGINFLLNVDRIVALWVILLTLPLTLLVGLIALLTTGHFFQKVERVGTRMGSLGDGRSPEPYTFKMLQFKTRHQDGRFTLLGKMFERLDIHRWPQLWNILAGDIRFVGVKPLTVAQASLVVETWQRTRYEAMAGFTGLWYIQTTQQSELDEIIIADAYYTATRNWREDLKLLLKTPKAWLRHMATNNQS